MAILKVTFCCYTFLFKGELFCCHLILLSPGFWCPTGKKSTVNCIFSHAFSFVSYADDDKIAKLKGMHKIVALVKSFSLL
jgi:hypothetical protein